MAEIALPLQPTIDRPLMVEAPMGFFLGAGSSLAAGFLLWLGVVVFAGGPQTGADHALPATLALFLLNLGVLQGTWLLPGFYLALKAGRRALGWGLISGGAAIAALNFGATLILSRV